MPTLDLNNGTAIHEQSLFVNGRRAGTRPWPAIDAKLAEGAVGALAG